MLARSDVDKGCAFVLLASSVPEKVDGAKRWKGPMSLTSPRTHIDDLSIRFGVSFVCGQPSLHVSSMFHNV